MGSRRNAFLNKVVSAGHRSLPLSRLKWLRGLAVWAPTAFVALLLTFALTFHHTFPVWLLVLPILGVSAAGASLFSWFVFAQIEQREEALGRSERQSRELVQSLDAIVWEADSATWQFTFVSDRAEAILGYPVEQWLTEPEFWVNHLHPEDREQAVAFCRAATSEGRNHQFEHRALAADGRVVWLRDIVRVVKDEEGRVRQLLGLMVDITERKRAEEALRETNDTLEAVIQASPMGITILDSNGNVTLWNAAAERIFGWRKEEVLGRPLPSIPFDKSEEHRAFRERVLRGEAFSDTEVVRQKKDGSRVHISLSTAPLRDAKGDIWGAMGIMADITERKHAETTRHALYQASLQIQEPLGLQERLDRLLQTAQTVLALDRINVLLADPEGRELRAVASLGVDEPLDAIRVPIGAAGGALAEAYRTHQMIIWDGRLPLPEPLRLQSPYNQIAAFRSRVFANVPLVVQGRAIGVLGADRKRSRRPFEPVTLELLQLFASQAALAIEHGRLYEEQRIASIQLEATVEARTRELQTANLRLEEASRHKSAFLANMSHELRTPLNSILGFSQLLQNPTFGPLTAKQARHVDHILRSGWHLLALINDLLDLSKVEAGKLDLRLEVFELRDSLSAALTEIRPQSEAKPLQLELQVDPSLTTLTADPVRFKQILLNLLSNAVKFTPEGGVVTVSARPVRPADSEVRRGSGTAELIEIAVQDTGIGIKAEDLPKLFQPFTQLESPYVKRHQGTGLGLALTKRLLELHDGTIWAESEGEGKGSRFTVLLPRAGPRSAPRLLLVEDDEALAAALRDGLQAAGFQVDTTRDGTTALACIPACRPDLVILDLGLPTVDGWEVLRQLRADASTRCLPVLTITGVDMELGEKALTAGADEFLTKPFSLTVLEATIRRLLRRGASADSTRGDRATA